MAETQEPRTGWGGEVHLSSDATTANLYELVQVVSFGLPQPETADVESTHLKSPGKRREFIAGLIDGGSVDVVLNYRPGSDSDIKIRSARDARDVRAIRFVIPDQAGDPEWQVDTTGLVTAYKPGDVTADGKIEATMTVRISGDVTEAAAS
jgi:hypothetical protein